MLELSDKINNHIQGDSTNLYAFVVIGSELSDESINVSMIPESIKNDNSNESLVFSFKDYNLKISNLKHSLDIQKHSFKTSNLTMSLNNYNRLSDNPLMRINIPIKVYYKNNSINNITDSVLVYTGKIKEISHDNNNINLTLEDYSLDLDVDIPYANIGYSENAYNKNYINRPIPITYGEVDKAPVIPYLYNTDSGESKIVLLPDDIDSITRPGFSNENKRNIRISGFFNETSLSHYTNFVSTEESENIHPLYIYKDDYFRVLNEFQPSLSTLGSLSAYGYTNSIQYNIDDNYIEMIKDYTSGYPLNSVANNELQAIKILRPNELKILRSENDEGEEVSQGSVGSVFEINPFQGILRPEAAIDSNDSPSSIMNQTGAIDEFETFSEVPNSQPSLAWIPELSNLTVNNFIPYNSNYGGYYYPNDSVWAGFDFHYLYTKRSFLVMNSVEVPVRFVKFPSSSKILEEANNKMVELGYKETLNNDFFSHNSNGKKAEILFQYCLDLNFRKHYMIQGGKDPEQQYPITAYGWGAFGPSAEPFPVQGLELWPLPGTEYTNADYPVAHVSVNAPLNSQILNDDDTSSSYWGNYTARASGWQSYNLNNTGDRVDRDHNASEAFYNQNGDNGNFSFPTTVYKIWCDSTENNSDNLQDIKRVYIGQYIPETMPPYQQILQDGIVWINIVYDSNNETIPYLYSSADDFAQFKTISQNYTNTYADTDDVSMNQQFQALWNGAPINNEAYYSGNSDKIENKIFGNNFGNYLNPLDYEQDGNNLYANGHVIKQNQLCNEDSGWFLYIEDNIDTEVFGVENLDYVNNNNNTDILNSGSSMGCKKGTIIPWNHLSYSGNQLGNNLSYDFVSSKDLENIEIVSGGNAGGLERRLSLLFTFNDINSSDAIEGETKTNFWGKFSVNIPPESTTEDLFHNVESSDSLIVSAIATVTVENNNTNANALVPYEGSGFNIIEKTGTDLTSLLTDGSEIVYDIRDADPDSLFNQLSKNHISDWDHPDYFNALTLNYRLIGGNSQSYLKFNSHIHSIGLLQSTLFENALNSDFYADVIGRQKENLIDIIESPESIMEDIINREIKSTNEIETQVNNVLGINIDFAFTIKEEINAKKLIQNLASNSNLYPQFINSENKFTLSEIHKTYTDASVDRTILAKDIINFNFKRTPSTDIKTMVNIKYKKDYATDIYTRETGWCDGYDFFGNGENKTNYYHFDHQNGTTTEKAGYDYSDNGLIRESNMYTLESEYIRSRESAIALRDYIFMLNCNYHNIIDVELPIKYFNLEVGDVVNFDSLFNDLKIYGEDYTSKEVYRNGQKIYPYFLITSITKSTKKVKINLFQLHKLEREFTAGLGSLSRKSNIGIQSYEHHHSDYVSTYVLGNMETPQFFTNSFGYLTAEMIESLVGQGEYLVYLYPQMLEHLTITDLNILNEVIAGDVKTLTTDQVKNADLHRTGNIDIHDLNVMQIFIQFHNDGIFNNNINLSQFYTMEDPLDWNIYSDKDIIGDLNEDGIMNVIDLVAMVSIILGSTDPSSDQQLIGDVNYDGVINVVDVVALVNQILS